MKRLVACVLAVLVLGAAGSTSPTDVRTDFRGVLSDNLDARAFNVTADTYMPAGTAVAGYFTTNKYGNGPAFGLLAEVEDMTGKGPLWGLEVDAFSIGREYPDTWLRRGLGVVVGVNQGRKVPTVIGFGIDVLPFYRDREYVTVNYGLNIGVRANIAAIAVQAGDKIALEPSGQVAIRFNPATGAVELLNGDRVLQSWK